MQCLPRFVFLLAAGILLAAAPAMSQDDTPSLGDVARQSRQQKQQKAAQSSSESKPEANSNNNGDQAKGSPAKDGPGSQASKDTKSSKGAQVVPASKKVITNEEIPEHVGPTRTAKSAQNGGEEEEPPQQENGKESADYWKSRIQSQKSAIAALKSDIDSMQSSIQYAGGNCVSGCAEWNERQQQKQQQIETMKSQLEEQQKQLEDMQEQARKQGYGSSVYDP